MRRGKGCSRTHPTSLLTIHLPASTLHDHLDVSETIMAATDYGLFANTIGAFLSLTGYAAHPGFLIGFFLDLINRFPAPIRTAIAQGIVLGLGTKVEDSEDGQGVTVSHVRAYEPLVLEKKNEEAPGFEERESGLVAPKNPGELILPS